MSLSALYCTTARYDRAVQSIGILNEYKYCSAGEKVIVYRSMSSSLDRSTNANNESKDSSWYLLEATKINKLKQWMKSGYTT